MKPTGRRRKHPTGRPEPVAKPNRRTKPPDKVQLTADMIDRRRVEMESLKWWTRNRPPGY